MQTQLSIVELVVSLDPLSRQREEELDLFRAHGAAVQGLVETQLVYHGLQNHVW